MFPHTYRKEPGRTARRRCCGSNARNKSHDTHDNSENATRTHALNSSPRDEHTYQQFPARTRPQQLQSKEVRFTHEASP